MKVLLKTFILAVFLLFAGFSQLNAQSHAERGTVIGAIIGAVVGHQSDEALAGAGVGAVIGYMFGNEADKRVVYTQPVVYQDQPRKVIRRDPVVYHPAPVQVVCRQTPVYYGSRYSSRSYGRTYRTGPVVIRAQVIVGSRPHRRW